MSDSTFLISTVRKGNLYYQYANNFADIYNNDTLMLDLTLYNFINKTKKRIGIKKPCIDSLISCSGSNLYVDKDKKTITMSYYQMPDSLFAAPINAIEFFKTKHIDFFDNQLNKINEFHIPFDNKYVRQNARPILLNDSALIKVRVDAYNSYNSLITSNLMTKTTKDSLLLNDSTDYVYNIDLINDTTIIAKSENSIQYFSTNLDSIYRVKITIPINVVPVFPKDPFLNIIDTTYYYHCTQVAPTSTSTNRSNKFSKW